MVISHLLTMQAELIFLMLAGVAVKRLGILSNEGLSGLSNLCINVIIPCNIFKSFLMDMDMGILRQCGQLLLCGIGMQAFYFILNRFFYNRQPEDARRIMQYCTFVPNGGFLGNAVAEGIYGSTGLLFANVFLIPQRMLVWSVGPTYFVSSKTTDKKEFIKSILTHPALVAIYLGLAVMVFRIPVPAVVSGTVGFLSNCNTALIMLIIGASIAEIDPRSMVTAKTLYFSFLRLIAFPLVALGIGMLCGISGMSMGINLLMAGMPAGTTSVIFARRYNSDPEFAGKCVLLSTVLSMVTLPLWILLVQVL